MADVPTFLKGAYEENWDYHEQTQQMLFGAIGPNGYQIPQLTRAQVATITSYKFGIVLPAGTVFFVTDYAGGPPTGKWAGISVAADPDTLTDATLVTFDTSAYI